MGKRGPRHEVSVGSLTGHNPVTCRTVVMDQFEEVQKIASCGWGIILASPYQCPSSYCLHH